MKKTNLKKAVSKAAAKALPAGKKSYVGSGVRLFRAADVQTRQRMPWLPIDHDSKHDITSYTQSRLRMLSRFLFFNVGFVHGSQEEIATYAIGKGIIPTSYAADPVWREQADEVIGQWMNICDLRGGIYDWRTDMFLSIISYLRDGDVYILKVKTASGYPLIQMIPGHRIGDGGEGFVKAGKFQGMPIFNGVIFNTTGRVVGYRILGDTPDKFTDVSARDIEPLFRPDFVDQGRGTPSLSPVILDHIDINDITEFEKFAAKLFASQTLIEETPGGADEGADFAGSTPTGEVQPGGNTKFFEDFDMGMIRKYRSQTGSNLKAFEQSRPNPNLMAFRRELMRVTYSQLCWPIEFSYDMSELGSGAIRAVLGKVTRTVEQHQMTVCRAAKSIIGWVVSCFIDLGILEPNVDWYKWDFLLPCRPSIDLGREAQQDRADLLLGVTTYRELLGKRGMDWQAVIDQRIVEQRYILDECKKYNVDPRYVQLLNPNQAPIPEGADDEEDVINQKKNKGKNENNDN